MDPVSQVSLGAVVGALFRPQLGGRAIVLGALCGGVPDLDVIVGITSGPWARMVHHRGATHALLVLALAAPLFGWIGYRWNRRQGGFRTWTHLAFWALVTHALLDWCTPYGTQLLWPFSRARLALDTTFSVDVFYTLPLLLLLLISLWPRFSPAIARRVALAGLVVSTGYLAFGFLQQHRGTALAREQLVELGVDPVAVRAIPTICNPYLRRIVARDESGDVYVGLLSLWNPRPIAFTRLARSDDPQVAAVQGSDRGQIFNWFADGMVSSAIEHQGNHTRVELRDQRYGFFVEPAQSMIRVEAELDADGRIVRFGRAQRRRLEFSAEYRRLRELLAGEARTVPELRVTPN